MPTYVDHIPLCTGCGIPLDEMPDSEPTWAILTKVLPCPAGDPRCPGHVRECRIYCTRCQKEGKADEVPNGQPIPPS